jgi:hypothetical protein
VRQENFAPEAFSSASELVRTFLISLAKISPS